VSDSVDLEVAIKQLIIDSLMLEDLTVAEIESDAPLSSKGWGSIHRRPRAAMG
jgi:hypothetical protein